MERQRLIKSIIMGMGLTLPFVMIVVFLNEPHIYQDAGAMTWPTSRWHLLALAAFLTIVHTFAVYTTISVSKIRSKNETED